VNEGNISCDPSTSVSEAKRQLDGTVISSAVCAPVSIVSVFDITGSLRQKHHALKTSLCEPNTRKYAILTVSRAETLAKGCTIHAAMHQVFFFLRTGRGIDVPYVSVVIPYGPKTGPKGGKRYLDERLQDRIPETRYAHETAEEIEHENDESKGERDGAKLRLSSAADLA
jgi:hypothetical protein